jgi:hypothetical protein
MALEFTERRIRNFLARIEKTDTCWLWRGYKTRLGYGVVTFGQRRPLAHRVSFELYCREIPDGMKVLHRCDVRNCVRPSHLFLGTQLDNIKDMETKGRRSRKSINVGENHGRAKLTEGDVALIRTMTHIPARVLAETLGVSQNTVGKIRLGRTWKHRSHRQ